MKKHDIHYERILIVAQNHMLKYGFRKAAMDKIAHDLGMSKNTIYKYFVSKDELAEVIYKKLKAEMNHELTIIREACPEPLMIISKSVFYIQQTLSPWYEHFFQDIPHDKPRMWKDFMDFRDYHIHLMQDLINKGIKDGQFRPVQEAIAMGMYLGAMEYVLNPEFLKKERISFADALDEVVDIWSRGLISKTKK